MDSPRDEQQVTEDPVLVLDALVIDCDDPQAVGRFWQQLLGGDLREVRDGDTELHGAALRLDFVRAPAERTTAKDRLHLDIFVQPDLRQKAIDRAIAFGATTANDIYDGGLWQVMRDIEGNVFCIVWGGAE
ncbi:VOC family protein [Kribbella deserti]|uniref:VOC family protein n=1 Tax=Kribbella deserti TaxID=1926257 RepID=A0ABV6QIT6_9ACTN